mmetsp:Transcript_35837/g.73198  ORF Transcript_35837/g.73198 Transcript_35837/m.73198 type:complete len:81 (+) Transcript_35837:643-885(+)
MHLSDALKFFDDLDDNKGLQHPHKKTVHNRHSAVSTEQLKQKKIPMSLCDLIANMIDCTNGELSDSESYRSCLMFSLTCS